MYIFNDFEVIKTERLFDECRGRFSLLCLQLRSLGQRLTVNVNVKFSEAWLLILLPKEVGETSEEIFNTNSGLDLNGQSYYVSVSVKILPCNG